MVLNIRKVADEELQVSNPVVRKPKLNIRKVTEEEAISSDEELVRPSDPFKQGLAGISDIATSIPALLGLIGSGLEAGTSTITGDQGFLENFEEAISSGVDRSLLEAGESGRLAVNEFLGITDPVSAEDQIARALGMFIPLPGIRVAAGAGKLARLGTHAANLLTPMVRLQKTSRFPFRDKLLGRMTDTTILNKGNAMRIAAQLGIGVGADQGIRALIGAPTIFDESAYIGIPANNPLLDQESMNILSGSEGQAELIGGEQGRLNIRKDPNYVSEGTEVIRELDLKVEKAQDWEDVKFWATVAFASIGSIAAIKYTQRLAHKAALTNSPFGAADITGTKLGKAGAVIDPTRIFTEPVQYVKDIPGFLKQGGEDSLEYLGEFYTDSGQAVYNAAIARGFSKEVAQELQTNTHTDPLGMATRVWDEGRFGQGTGITTHSGRQIEVDYAALGEDRQLFNEYMIARTLRASGGTVGKSQLWKVGRTTDELDDIIKAGDANTNIVALSDKFDGIFRAHLEYQVARKLLTQTEANQFIAKFSTGDKIAYLPLYDTSQLGFLPRLGRVFGIRKGGTMTKPVLMGEHHTRGPLGVANPLAPLKALRQYTMHSIDVVNSNAAKKQVLFRLSGVQAHLNKITKELDIGRFTLDKDGNIRPTVGGPRPEHSARNTTYIGKGKITDETERIHIDIDPDAPDNFKAGTVADLNKDFPTEIVTVQHQGELLAFHVPDVGIRAAVDMNPRLTGGQHFMNHWKGLFTRFTTGNLSLFAPISHAFSAQQVAINTAARYQGKFGALGGIGQGLKSIGQGIRGSQELFMAEASQEIAQYLSFRLAKHAGTTGPGIRATEGVRNWLQKRFAGSMINPVRGETGRISSSLQATTFTGSVDDFAQTVGAEFGQFYGLDELGLVWRMWKAWNTALHEGPAFGAMQRHIGDARRAGQVIDEKVIRGAVDASKSVAGDMRRLGASEKAKWFNASVPFSAAMIQSWHSIGAAATHNGMASFGKFTAGVAAIIGVPTVAEMVHNTLLSEQTNPDGTPVTFEDASGKKWTYNDYYWNGYTTQQRADNMIIFVPGRAPWEAILMPISPEWGLFRGAVMDGIDAAFNLSNTGAIAEADQGQDKVARTQFIGSLLRVLDIPLPPVFAATASAFGVDIRLGLSVEETHDPDDPGTDISLIRHVPLGKGERITRRAGKTKFAMGELDIATTAMIQDIFGSGGALYVAAYEAYNAGKGVKGGTITDGISDAAEAFGDGLRRQARWTQPLWGKTMRPKAGGEIASDLFNRRTALVRLSNDFNAYVKTSQGFPGDTVIPPDDPINLELAADAKKVLTSIGKLDSQVSKLRTDISTIGNATNMGSFRERNSLIDSMNLQIQALKAQQLGFILDYEARISDYLSNRYDREININLASFTPRANLETSSIFQELRLPRQTSQ